MARNQASPKGTPPLDERRVAGFRRVAELDHAPETIVAVRRAVARAQAGDRDALRFLYAQYVDNVYGYVLSVVHDEHDAEDVTQQVFAKLMTVLPKYREQDVPFAGWLLRISRNAALDWLRGKRAIPCGEVRPVGFERGDDGANERAVLLRDALSALPEDQRKVVVLRHVVGLTPGEIARRMGKTEPAIHGLHNRGRSALRLALTARDCSPVTRVAA
jgi:RNA polymerase sigma-70 factor (ECF subfamily)